MAANTENEGFEPDFFLKDLQAFIVQRYEPVATPGPGVIQMTTHELSDVLHSHYPAAGFTFEEIARWLSHAGFTYTEHGLNFEWLLKKKKTS